MRSILYFSLLILTTLIIPPAFAGKDVVNVYAWAEEIPSSIIEQFENETGIKVNYATYESNEIMYAKLRTSRNVGYDLVEPSSYYVERLWRQGRLEKLDKTKLPNFKNLDAFFINQAYDPHSNYSIPFIWGSTGIYINRNYFPSRSISRWADLLDKKYLNQLMLIDDPREVFSIAMLILGYSINDKNPDHIKQAFLKLKELIHNVRVFNTDAIVSILIDEDATVGMVWNGDLFNAYQENAKLEFVFPTDGFEIWVDNFAILNDAPHRDNAYRFLDFLMRPDVAKDISLNINYSTANLAAQNIMPDYIKNDPVLYPSHEILSRGQFETDIGDDTFALFEKYWEQLKMGA